VGWGEVAHLWWSYHPRRFGLWLNSDPRFQQQGTGSALYSRLIQHAEGQWSAEVIRCETRENRPRSLSFLERRGFGLRNRRWEARLLLERAHLERLAEAQRRLADQGVRVVTMADEQRRGSEQMVRDLFELEQRAARDEPGYDPEGAMQFDQFVANELDQASRVDDGSFLAYDGSRLVGVSRLMREPSEPTSLNVGFTGTDPDYRGRGVAMALKLRTLEYARERGFEQIRTQNDALNVGMLHINDELGFEREPAWLVYERMVGNTSEPGATHV
jgi:GNAT superfamily N-acetyltransferase